MKTGFLKPESTNKAIVFSMSFSMIAKMFNFAQSIVVSYAFGMQTSTDILFYVLSTVILLTTVITQINQYVIVPNAVDIRNNYSEEDSRNFISYVYLFYLMTGAVVTALLMVSPQRVMEILSRFKAQDIQANIAIVRYILPSFFLIIVNTYILDIFTSYRYFTLPMMLDMLKNMIIIASVLAFKSSFSVSSLALGIFAGNAIQFLILNFLLFTALKCRFSFKKYNISSEIKRNIAYVVVGQFSTFLNGFAVSYLMTGFNAGVYSAMDYSQKINTVFNTVIIGQITTVVGMNIIELHSKKDFRSVNETFMNYFKASLFFIVPFCFTVALNAQPVISIIFERGKFNHESVVSTSRFLKYFIFTLPYYLINGFIVRLIIAKQIQRVSFWWNLFQSMGNIIVIYAAIRLFGYMGYPLGILAANYIYIVLLLHFLLKHQFEYIRRTEVIRYFALTGLIGFAASAAAYYCTAGFTTGNTLLGKILRISFVSAVFMGIYLGIGFISGVHRREIRKFFGQAGSVLRKKAGPAARKQPDSDETGKLPAPSTLLDRNTGVD